MQHKILFITTSCATLGNSGKATGIWAEELIVPYYAFVDAGVKVDLASTRGGAVPFDPGSLKPKGQNSAIIERFLADATAQERINATKVVASFTADKYDPRFPISPHFLMEANRTSA